MTEPLTQLAAQEYYQALATILDSHDQPRIARLRYNLGLPPAAINNAPPTPNAFKYPQVEAAMIVTKAHRLKSPNTFQKNQPWRLLEKNGLGEGIGFVTRATKNKRGETRGYSKDAIDFLCIKKNWGLTRSLLKPR
jgi:hypothetical protein